MAKTVLRARLISGDRFDVTYEDPEIGEVGEVVERAISTLGDGSGVLRCQHGDRLFVLYGRGVAALEIAPRGAVL